MPLSPSLEAVIRDEVRKAFGAEPTAESVSADLWEVVRSAPTEQARRFVARVAEACFDYLEATEPERATPDTSTGAESGEKGDHE